MANYVVVYDILREPSSPFLDVSAALLKVQPTLFFAAVLITLGFVIYIIGPHKVTARQMKYSGIVAVVIGILFIAMYGRSENLVEQENFKRLLESGHALFVEGMVTDFRPMPFEGHAFESFRVKNIRFGYSDDWYSGGFNNAASRGGPIYKNGMYVRIYYISRETANFLSPVILQMEVSSPSAN